MTFFKGKFSRFITFNSVGLIYNIIGVILLSVFYKTTFRYGDAWVNNKITGERFHFLLSFPEERTAPILCFVLFLIIIGFFLLLAGEFLSYLNRKTIIKNLVIIKSSLISLLFTLGFFVSLSFLLSSVSFKKIKFALYFPSIAFDNNFIQGTFPFLIVFIIFFLSSYYLIKGRNSHIT